MTALAIQRPRLWLPTFEPWRLLRPLKMAIEGQFAPYQSIQGEDLGRIFPGSGGNDAYTKLLLHCDGADASTTFTDSSASAHTVTPAGNAQIDTAQSKFGGSSGLFDGTGDYLSFANNLAITGQDFTIDWWQRQASRTAGEFDSPWRYDNEVGTYKGKMYLSVGTGNTGHGFLVANTALTGWVVQIDLGALPSLNAWHHYAVVRNGSTWTVYIDGSSVGSASSAQAIVAPTGNFEIGWSGTADSYMDGWIDEFRVSVGIARWTANFTPPTAAY